VPTRFNIIDLGTLGGDPTIAYGLNNHAQASGFGTTADGATHGFIWQDGHMYDVGTLGGDFSEASLINNRGQAIGDSTTASGESHLAKWAIHDGHVESTDLGILPGAVGMYGAVINDHDQAAGAAFFDDGSGHTVLADRHGLHDLHNQVTLGGASDLPGSITETGQIVGVADTDGPDSHGYYFDGASVQDLGTLTGNWSEAYTINAAGQITGIAGTDPTQHCAILTMGHFYCGFDEPGLHMHAFLYSNGAMQDLGPVQGFDESLGIWLDARGQVFGASETTQEDSSVATMWVHGRAIDMNNLLDGPPADLAVLDFIWLGNSRGQLVATGLTTDGQEHSYLLTPEEQDHDVLISSLAGHVITDASVLGSVLTSLPVGTAFDSVSTGSEHMNMPSGPTGLPRSVVPPVECMVEDAAAQAGLNPLFQQASRRHHGGRGLGATALDLPSADLNADLGLGIMCGEISD
jgi:probable HAF family extracellular repeat protein